MRIFHGTNLRSLKSIESVGLLPIGDRTGNWKQPSRRNFTYFSDTYPGYYAMCSLKNDDVPIIIEFEVEEEKLYPDEDFLGQVLKKQYPALDLNIITEDVDIELNKELWKSSLELLGTVAHKGRVGKERIINFVEIPKEFRIAFLDPSISLINHKILGNKYRLMVKYLFGYEKENPLEVERRIFESFQKKNKDEDLQEQYKKYFGGNIEVN